MRFSTVVAVSAAALASSAVALPTPATHAGSTTSTSSTSNKAAALGSTPKSATQQPKKLADAHSSNVHTKNTASGARSPTQSLTKTPQLKKPVLLTGAQRGQVDLSTARTDYSKAEKEYKQAQSDLAASRKLEKQALGDYGLGNLDKGLTRRDLDLEDLLESLAARGLFDEDDELFGRAPTSHTASTPAHSTTHTLTSGARSTSQHGAKTAKPVRKLSGAQDLSLARTDYTKAEKEYKQAEGDLAASRKMEKQGVSAYGLGNLGAGLKARDLDVEDLLESLAARGFFDEDDELFGRAPTSHTASTPAHSTPHTLASGPHSTSQHGSKTAKPVRKLSGAQDLSIARTDYTKAEKEFKEAQGDLATSRKMEKQGVSAYGLGNLGAGLKARDLDVEALLESLAARGFFDEDDELFGRAPGIHTASTGTPAHSTTHTLASGARSTSQHGSKTAKPLRKLSGAQDLSLARTDYTKAEKEFKEAQGDLSASRKMEKQGVSAYGLDNIGAGLKARDLDNVEALMEIIARGYYGANEEY